MTKDQMQENIRTFLVEIDRVREHAVSLQDMVAQIPDPVEAEAEVKRRVAATIRAAAEKMEAEADSDAAVSGVAQATFDSTGEQSIPESGSVKPFGVFPRDESGDYVLAEAVEQAQAILGQVETEEYPKSEPDEPRLQKYRRHATQTEAAHR